MQATVFVATSADGFIARRDGSIDWLPAPEGDDDYGFTDLLASVDALVMGRNTFEVVRQHGDPWPYGDLPLIVLSHRELDLPPHLAHRVERMAASPEAVAAELDARGLRRAYVDGGEVIRGFLRAGIVDRIIVTQLPILIGSGIPLFGPLESDAALRLEACRSYPNGWIQYEYRVV